MRTLLAAARASNRNVPFQSGDRWILSLSLWHIGGLAIFFRALCGGGTIVINEKKTSLARAIEKYDVTHLSVVALQLQRILDSNLPRQSLKHVLVGGGPIPEQLIKDACDSLIPIHTTYGMTELGSQLTTTPTGASQEELKTAGRPLEGWEIKIADDNEICARGNALFSGYLQQQEIKPSRDVDGWFRTGDLGRILENGCLLVLGRKDAQFISGGENIYPEEIEQILTNFSPVQLAIVVPIPNKTYGYRPAAFVLGSFSEPDLRKYLEHHLPKFKHPDVFLPWPSHVSTHKPSRSELHSIALHLMK
jgi:O-succinylbenzoic acid--CoA ligase